MDIRHTITRFGATALIGCGLVVTAIPATFAQNGEESVTHVYSDKATSHISEVWYKGETLKVTGEGFLTQDGTSGSVIAIKLNKGSVKIDGKDYLEVQADEKGNFSVSIPSVSPSATASASASVGRLPPLRLLLLRARRHLLLSRLPLLLIRTHPLRTMRRISWVIPPPLPSR